MSKTTHHGGSWDWDCTIVLEYAEEQLYKAAQLLTCEIAPSTEVRSNSYLMCISSILQHEGLLPDHVANGLRNARQEYLRNLPPSLGKIRCDCLASRMLAILQDVRNLLAATKLRVAA